jgi:uncharacterized membrane protein YkoI
MKEPQMGMFWKIMLLLFFDTIFANAAVAGQLEQSVPLHQNNSGQAFPVLIGETKAVEIALGQAGGGQIVGVKLKRREHGGTVYSVLAVDGDIRVSVMVDAKSGGVVKLNRENIERVEYPGKWPGGRVLPTTAVAFDNARKIALEKTGGGTVIDVQKEFKKDGRILYDVEVIDAGREFEIEIDAQTGAIIEYQEKQWDS